MPPWFATLPLSVLQASGGVIALFVGFHILQLTIGATHPAFVRDDPYHDLVVALRFWPVAMAYIAAAAAVGVHLLPGFWTGMASLGPIRHRTELRPYPRSRCFRRTASAMHAQCKVQPAVYPRSGCAQVAQQMLW